MYMCGGCSTVIKILTSRLPGILFHQPKGETKMMGNSPIHWALPKHCKVVDCEGWMLIGSLHKNKFIDPLIQRFDPPKKWFGKDIDPLWNMQVWVSLRNFSVLATPNLYIDIRYSHSRILDTCCFISTCLHWKTHSARHLPVFWSDYRPKLDFSMASKSLVFVKDPCKPWGTVSCIFCNTPLKFT